VPPLFPLSLDLCRPNLGDCMTAQPSLRQSSASVPTPRIDERRRAPWLLAPYSGPVWIVADTRDARKTATIDFRVTLADGRSLVDNERLYATVKEYAWWLRDPRYSRIDDATTHATMVRNLINLAHALTLRGIASFSHLQPYDVDQLVEDCRYGADAVLQASERVGTYLGRLASEHAAHPKPFGGLPRYVIPRSGARTTSIDAGQIVAACNLPSSASRLPRVAALIARAGLANGMRVKFGNTEGELASLPNVTIQCLQRWLDPLELLYAMRRRMEAESISFKPFPLGAARVAAVKGVGVDRTPIPPPKLVIQLIEHAARWIFDRADALLVGVFDRENVLRMATACWIIIAAFTARRDEEIDGLQEGCLRGDADTGWWLHVYIEKTLQQKEWIPVPGLVARAVEVLLAMSAEARVVSGDNKLFQWCPADGKVVTLDVGRHLDDFASLVHLPLHQLDGASPNAWHWHPHQFRRFFAVLYFYRFEGATIEALSHYLRHFSLEMTKRYVTQDPEVAAIWTDVEWGYMGYVARSIVAGERSVSGAMGERLKRTARRLIDLFRRKLQVASPERVGASLTLVMQRQGLVLTPKPWVTCSCPRTHEAALKAACRRGRMVDRDAIGPNFAQAGPTVCSFCPHAVTEKTRGSVVSAEVVHLETSAENGLRAGTLFGVLEEARMIELRQIHDTRYVNAKPLQSMSPAGEDGK
jgi:hypothetical protein